jgi:Spy/CpxP family protein refolding chaperone
MKTTSAVFLTIMCSLAAAVSQESPGKPRPNRRGEALDREPRREAGAQEYSIEQALSEKAQLHTIAFSGLAFITGDFGASTFIPPGKVCDYFGFQYMRDIDAARKGHNPMFLNRVAGNVFQVLNEDQENLFSSLAEEQAPQLEELAKLRLPMIKAFWLHLGGKPGLSKEATVRHTGIIFEKDMELSLRRAEVMAQVHNSLDSEQKAYLAKMKFGDFNTWPALDERDMLKRGGRGKSKLFNVANMTYASEYFSWTAGNTEADTYFCPERHGTYFGGFYMKDMPAMGKRDYDISTAVTGDSGEAFIEKVLTQEQRKHILDILSKQKAALRETISVRREISTELRKLLNGGKPDKAKLMDLGRHYGELDGEMSWYYATAFADVNKTLTADQRAALMKLRNLEGYTSAPCYIYSQPLEEQPALDGVEVFFK